mmetsp:Transcript_37029/g.66647  ORF Transcript_37029/g.66647 Transcript_37029/m.66647 type:complete len:622 (+) Transcript_37029:243-2108(+)|eukprot:CAMPEP_0201896634 /NCGR_PEP_ID=MMETSP0902-20130614/45017_1 /ASSEMBLY_ACC=CAM_ASM_000551 /TAXON_ID=420261 /ORGANISM="Thalassiosira antarctica, Strain CCMP982" /LENGTH=621 /DNA_ID=CAMNT_0048429277 /DNA_START=144 /DNA_END=2009 /DNA_ORIENTATION=+
MGTRGKGQPDGEIYNLFATLNEEQQREKHDISGLYQGRLRSHALNFEGLKRKWEGFTGVPVPKKLRTSEPDDPPVQKENAVPNHPIAQLDQKPAAKTAKKTKTVPAKKAAPATMPSHPDDKLNVNSMIVNDLRKELRKKQLSTAGRKAELQERLRHNLAEAKQKREAEWAAKHPVKKAVKIGNDGKSGSYKDVKEMDVVMEDATEADVSMKHDSEKVAKIPIFAKPTKDSASVGAMKNAMKKHAPKSALKPSKYTSSIVQSTPHLDDAKPAAKPVPSSLAKEDLLAPKQLIPSKVSDSSIESSNNSAVVSNPTTQSKALQSSVQKTKISSTLAKTSPGGSAFKMKFGGAGTAKLLEKKKAHAAASEARKARMAEMRQKSKPSAASVSSATKPPPSHSKYAVSSTLKKMASSSTLGESKPNNILAKMREKAAAEKNTENVVPPPTKPTSTTSSSSTVNRVSQVTTSKPASKSTALKSILDPANKPVVSAPAKPEVAKPEAAKPEEKPLSPMQTYEMSDREEESDSESESDDEYEKPGPKKNIPEWAQKANLHRALERQFADGPDRQDPDKIFGEVITCNLEEIFDKKKSRYQRRTSSGNWTKDHVTLAEKLTYKRVMGYDKK